MKDKLVSKNNIKKLFRWLLNIVLVFITIPIVLTFMFRDPMVQSLSARMLTKWLSEKSGYEIKLEKVRITVFDGIELQGLKVNDHRGEVLLHVNHLMAQPVFADWSLSLLKFRSLTIDGAHFRYARYAEDEDYNLKILINSYLRSDSSGSNTGSSDFRITSSKLELTNSIFHFYDEHKHYNNGIAMDYGDMLIDSIYLYSHQFQLINDSLSIGVDSLFAHEKCGFSVDRMSADFGISNTNLRAHNLLIESDDSFIDLDLDFDYKSWQSYSSFLDSVVMTGNIRPSTIDLSVVGYFADIMFSMPNILGISGLVTGTVADMKGDKLRIKYASDTRFYGNAMIQGLPDFFTSYMEAEIFELSSSACDLRSFRLPIEEESVDMTGLVECNEVFTAKGEFKGYYEDFKTQLSIKANEGIMDADISFTRIENDTIYFTAWLKGDTIDIGRLLDVDDLFGRTTMDVKVNAFGNNFDDIKIEGDGFFKAIDFLNYNYKLVGVKGWYQNDSIDGNLRIGDKNLMMNADVSLSLNKGPLLAVQTAIKYADLKKLQFIKDRDLRIATNLNLDLNGFDADSMTGIMTMNNSILYFGKEKYEMKKAVISKSKDEENDDVIEILTDYADAKMTGNYRITEFERNLSGLFDHYYSLGDINKDSTFSSGQKAEITIEVKNSILLEEQIIPGLYISPATNLKAEIDFEDNQMLLNLSSENIEYQGISFNGNNFTMETDDIRLLFDYNIDNIIFKDSTPDDKTVFGIDNLSLNGSAGSDSIAYRLFWDNKDSLVRNSSIVQGQMRYFPDLSVFEIIESEIYVNDTLWKIDKGNSIVMGRGETYFNDIVIHGGQSMMKVSGELPKSDKDTLNVEFTDWKLSHFDILTTALKFDLNGKINGYINISKAFDNPTFVSDLTIDDFYFNREYLGTAKLNSTWNNERKSVFISSEIIRKGVSGEGKVFSAKGFYYPFREIEGLDMKIDFNRLNIKVIEPFFIDYISSLEGVASGNFTLSGTPQRPQFVGMIDMKRAAMVVNYLNAKYSFSNSIIFEPNRINFSELVIYDTLGNHANIDGYLSHDHFTNSAFDVRLSTDKLLFFNTTRKMNNLYYGSAITSGELLLTGSLNEINLDMDVSTLDGTNVSLPLDYSVEISDKDYIIFINPEADTINLELEKQIEEELSENSEELKYKIGLKMDINPKAKVAIYVPNDLGKIESYGEGNLEMNFNSSGDYRMAGDYVVDKGIFNFSIANLVRKRFELVKGGRISWLGDPYTANLNIKGLYRVKTNLTSLGIVVDSTSDYKNNVNVECYIVLTNQLLNPDIRFEIKMPELDPDLQRAVFAEIDTTNIAMLNQQVISLLVLGTFSASNASNINLGTAYYSVITNQLSKMLSRISDDFDIGVNYKPGDQVSQEEFELALSTQLFDNRLTVSGNVGMTYDRVQKNASNIVGDVDVSYKITEDGRWVLKAYNHSNVNSWYNYSNYDKTSPYTQGVGVAYTKEFNSISELFTRTRPRKKDRINKEAKIEDNEN